MKKFKQLLKDAKGFTLVELLAVIVILGIIAAIAVPSVTGLIDRSEQDATVSNAEQMVEAARLMVTQENIEGSQWIDLTGNHTPNNGGPYSLIDGGYIEDGLVDTEGKEYSNGGVLYDPASAGEGSSPYYVFLEGEVYSIGQESAPVNQTELDRGSVSENPN